jgi:7-carboxy-7-deazaguanine synthase
MSVEALVDEAESLGTKLIEITGGEPLLQEETPELVKTLIERGNTVLIETNGSIGIDMLDPRAHVILDMKCPRSGMCAKMRMDNLGIIKPGDEVKFVLTDRVDYEWAKGIIGLHGIEGRAGILLAPVYGKLDHRELAGWMLEDRLKARFNLQLHKYIFGPEERGV